MNTNYLFSHLAYRIASYVEDTRSSDSLLDELDFSIPDLQQALCRFTKRTVLHFYIFRCIQLYYERDFRKGVALLEQWLSGRLCRHSAVR